MKNVLIVMLGGGLGSVMRYLAGDLVKKYMPVPFPIATLIINIVGSLLIGVIIGYTIQHNKINSNVVLFLATGFCGGFTTFSAFTLENLSLLQNGQITTAILYTSMSIVCGILSVWLGYTLGKSVLV